jgi:hypothetical protein
MGEVLDIAGRSLGLDSYACCFLDIPVFLHIPAFQALDMSSGYFLLARSMWGIVELRKFVEA